MAVYIMEYMQLFILVYLHRKNVYVNFKISIAYIYNVKNILYIFTHMYNL